MTSPEARRSTAPAHRLLRHQGRAVAVADRLPRAAGAVLRRRRPGCHVGVRRQHVHPRVRARRPPPPRLPLPLTRQEGTTENGKADHRARPPGRRPRRRARIRLREDLRRARDRPGDRLRGRHRRRARGHGGGRGRAGTATARAASCSPAACRSNIGMGFGVLLFSVAMGALFAVVFAVAYGRVGNVSARLLSVLVAGGMLSQPVDRPGAEVPAESAGDSASTRRSPSARCCTC